MQANLTLNVLEKWFVKILAARLEDCRDFWDHHGLYCEEQTSHTNTNILIVKDLLFLSICFVDVIVFSVFFFTQFGLSVLKQWKCALQQVSSLVKLMDIYKIQKKKNQMPHGKANDSVKKEFCE